MQKIKYGCLFVLWLPLAASADWFITLPEWRYEQTISAPATVETEINFTAPAEVSREYFTCGFIPPLSEVDLVLNNPKTIDLVAGKTYEVYIPIMGKEPVAVYRQMKMVDRKFNAWWAD